MKNRATTNQQNVAFLAVTVVSLWILSAAAFLPDWGHPVMVKYYKSHYGIEMASR